MKSRCYNPNDSHYQWYGAKGITICDEWMGENGLQNFFDWSLSHGYNENLTIDRKESTKGYSPDNCQWITRAENTSRAVSKAYPSVGFSNKLRSILSVTGHKPADLADCLGISVQSVRNKFSRDSFSAADLIKICDTLNCELSIKTNSGQIVCLGTDDLKDIETKNSNNSMQEG
jgi:hypothetical protein